jgi:hypothetical protein
MEDRAFGLAGNFLEVTLMNVPQRISFMVLAEGKSNFGNHQQ